MTYITTPLPGAVVLPNFQNSGEVASPLSGIGIELVKQFESEVARLKERLTILEADKITFQNEYDKLVAAAGQAVTTLEKADKVIDAHNTVVDLLLAKFIEYGHKEDKT